MIAEHVGQRVSDSNNHTSILNQTGLDWQVQMTAGVGGTLTDGTPIYTSKKCAVVRTDTNAVLGVVSPDYQVVQNEELAYMASQLHSTDVTVASGGELQGGSRVFLCLQSPSFNVGKGDDEVKPYLVLANGHDGKFSLHGLGTTIRVWCDNTLNAALSEGKKSNSLISIRHKGNMADKIGDLITALRVVNIQTEELRINANLMASYSMDHSSVSKYWENIYRNYIDRIPDSITDSKDNRDQKRYHSVRLKLWSIFDEEANALGANMWTAFNAITNHIDHNTTYRGDKRAENKFYGNIYGSAANKKKKILKHSLAMI